MYNLTNISLKRISIIGSDYGWEESALLSAFKAACFLGVSLDELVGFKGSESER
jgi:hypothetical protein